VVEIGSLSGPVAGSGLTGVEASGVVINKVCFCGVEIVQAV
jgi:hypothetical protein